MRKVKVGSWRKNSKPPRCPYVDMQSLRGRTMTDKELLELAAKAVGIDIEWYAPNVEVWDFVQVPNWNPLKDDGDALRLAVKLKMDVIQFSKCVRVDGKNHEDWYESLHEEHEDDPYAATRRAVVRCAAEIGKAMP